MRPSGHGKLGQGEIDPSWIGLYSGIGFGANFVESLTIRVEQEPSTLHTCSSETLKTLQKNQPAPTVPEVQVELQEFQ